MTFDRSPKPPECDHPLRALRAPVPETGPGVVPRTVLTCSACDQTWAGGHALAVFVVATQRKFAELESGIKLAEYARPPAPPAPKESID